MNTFLGLGHYYGSDNLSVRPSHDAADIEKILAAISLGFKNVNIKISYRDHITVSKFGITISLKSFSKIYGGDGFSWVLSIKGKGFFFP